jgi:proteasome activator subunit 4
MDMRGSYHGQRVQELVDRFKVWREERVPGVRAFQSMYDRYVWDTTSLRNRTDVFNRVGITVCKWLYQSLHDVHAISTFDYILPLMVYMCLLILGTVVDRDFTA